ncbi:MAG: glycoside hydrolase TIM-barrel-like domain-containing protein, partial [Altererythrobacter sp.]|nr:glycoside hydrolase TIM-barrel-like domain-containing protein [Altererythrobacter sp.]
MQMEFLNGLKNEEVRALPFVFEFWAMPHQLAPDGPWKSWVILGGRGAGKTRAGAEWVRAKVEGSLPTTEGEARRVALVGETFDQARDVMVFGDSGILACSPPDRRPKWEAGKRRLVWPNGAQAQVFSAHDYEGLRGPQFDAAWVDEVGCAAIDKGANQPNKFIDPKSSESSLPKYSDGARDDLMQMQYLRALSEFWGADENNPTGSYGAPMVATDRMFVWAWDARPYPFFPGNSDVWSDGENYARGHWLNGRVSARALSSVIKTICAEAGVTDVDVSRVYGLVRGFALEGGENARAALQPLMLAHGVDAIEKDGTL